MRGFTSPRPIRIGAMVVTAALAVAGLAACSSDSTDSGGKTVITVSGPNLWTNDGKSFGPAWEQLVSDFEAAEPSVEVHTNVLPLSSFYPTLSTQLTAGTATSLVFNQAAYEPGAVIALDDYLAKPNPYDTESATWLEAFNAEYFGPNLAVDGQGNHNFVPLTFSGTALLYNKTAFEDAGINAPIETFSDLMTACDSLASAGYAGISMDNSDAWASFFSNVIFEMMLAPQLSQLDVFDAAGDPGTAGKVTSKSMAKAVLTGELSAVTNPQVGEALTLIKDVYTRCATPNWSGVTGTSGAMSNPADFIQAKAAMSIGTSFAGGTLDSINFELGTMPFPTITKKTTDLAADVPARFGVSPYGAAFMIPSSTKNEEFDASLKFLQFATSPAQVEKLVEATTGIPSVTGAQLPAASEGFVAGDWGKSMLISSPLPAAPPGVSMIDVYNGFILGSKTFAEQQTHFDEMLRSYWEAAVKLNGWTSEDWAK